MKLGIPTHLRLAEKLSEHNAFTACGLYLDIDSTSSDTLAVDCIRCKSTKHFRSMDVLRIKRQSKGNKMKIDREEALINMQSTILCGGSITTMTTSNGWQKKWYRHNLIDVLEDSLSGNMARDLGAALVEFYKGENIDLYSSLSTALEKAVEEYCSDDIRIDEYIDALEDERLDSIARDKFEDELAEQRR